MWDLIVSVPDHCLSFYFDNRNQMRKFKMMHIMVLHYAHGDVHVLQISL